MPTSQGAAAPDPAVHLYWLPLGARDNTGCVRTNGRIYETIAAALEQRDRCRLFHTALEVRVGGEKFVVEMTPVWSGAPYLDTDDLRARRILDLTPTFPSATWGRDEQRTGEMRNSNSLTSWLLSSSGHDTALLEPPPRGHAPGWSAGLEVASRASAWRRQRANGPVRDGTLIPPSSGLQALRLPRRRS